MQAEVNVIHRNKPFLLNTFFYMSLSFWLNWKNRFFEEKINKIGRNSGKYFIFKQCTTGITFNTQITNTLM